MCLAIPGKILSIEGDGLNRRGRLSFGGAVREVSLACLAEARVGDYALAHAGYAISLIDEDEAQRVFEYLNQMDL